MSMSDRKKLSSVRQGKTRKFQIRQNESSPERDAIGKAISSLQAGKPDAALAVLKTLTTIDSSLKFYVTANAYEDGKPGEIFVRGDKIGGFLGGALDTVAILVSLGLQHGIPLKTITEKLRHQRFNPSGWTGDPDFPSCSSPLDLIAQWLDREFPTKEENT